MINDKLVIKYCSQYGLPLDLKKGLINLILSRYDEQVGLFKTEKPSIEEIMDVIFSQDLTLLFLLK